MKIYCCLHQHSALIVNSIVLALPLLLLSIFDTLLRQDALSSRHPMMLRQEQHSAPPTVATDIATYLQHLDRSRRYDLQVWLLLRHLHLF